LYIIVLTVAVGCFHYAPRNCPLPVFLFKAKKATPLVYTSVMPVNVTELQSPGIVAFEFIKYLKSDCIFGGEVRASTFHTIQEGDLMYNCITCK